MSSKLDIARQYVLENYNNGADFRWDMLSRKLQIAVSRPPCGLKDRCANETLAAERPGEALKDRLTAERQWQDLDTRAINSIACACATATQTNVTDREVRIVLNSEDIPAVNPLRDYVYHLDEYNPNDHNGHSWIDWLSDQVKVKGEEEDGNKTQADAQHWWRYCFKKWFVAMVACWLFDDVVNQEVLILIGRQGIYKTTWLERLMPPCLRAYCTKMANVRDLNKDERMRIAEFGLINLDEIDSMSDKELNQLKSIITSSDVNERAAYGYTKERRIRIASFCASGNKREFLTDQTGNRRWLPFEVESIESPYLYDNCFPYEQIYAEALYLLRNGFEYWFELEEIEAMESHVESFHVESNEEQLLPVYFQPANPGDAGAVFMSAAEISSLLVSYGNIRHPLQLCKLSTILQRHGYTPKKSHGKRGFVVLQVLDVTEQRKIDARTAGDAGDAGDAVF